MRYVPRRVVIEAFQLDSGRYVVVPEGGSPRLVEAVDFEATFETAHPTVADGIRAVVAGQPLPRPASETMAEAIAARTVLGGPNGSRPLRKTEDVDRAIEETRNQVATEPKVDVLGQAYKRGPGKGRKACPDCDTITGVRARACPDCGRAF